MIVMTRDRRARIATALVLLGLVFGVHGALAQSGDLPVIDASSGEPVAEDGGTESVSAWIEGLKVQMIFRENAWVNWIVLLGMTFAGLVLGRIAYMLLQRIGDRVARSRFTAEAEVFKGGSQPANLTVATLMVRIGISQILMSAPLRTFVDNVVVLLIYVAVFWYAFNLVNIVQMLLMRRAQKTESKIDDMLVQMIRKALRVFILLVGILLVAENVFNQDIGAWLAGLGIAGLAVSLAAQDSLKNIFGTITIMFDRPFKVGDRVNFAGYDGPVEQIGFRSTKIRTLSGHLVTVPNSKIVNEPVENIGARPYIRRLMNVTIPYDTPREKIERAVELIRGILNEEGIREAINGSVGADGFPPRVYFNDYNADSLNIIVIYWHFPPVYWDYLDHAQRVNLRLNEEFSGAGIEFAFPTQTLYLAGDPNRRLPVSVERDPADAAADADR